jgi:uncharacterized SAM-dependent methyltransferase
MQASVPAQVSVLDVRRDAREDTNVANVRAELLQGLQAPPGAKFIPTVLLYDVTGLKIYDKITTDAPEYYVCPSRPRPAPLLTAHSSLGQKSRSCATTRTTS